MKKSELKQLIKEAIITKVKDCNCGCNLYETVGKTLNENIGDYRFDIPQINSEYPLYINNKENADVLERILQDEGIRYERGGGKGFTDIGF